MLVRIVGYILKEEKQVFISLTSIFGIGRFRGIQICNKLNIDPFSRTKDLSNDQVRELNDYIYKNYKIGDDLKKDIISNIKNAINCGSYQGKRLKNGLPVHGQNTRSNGRTAKKIRI